jgi:hypothetical protein
MRWTARMLAIRRLFVHIGCGLGVPSMSPSVGSMTRHSLPSTGSGRARSPASRVLWRSMTSCLLPFGFVSLYLRLPGLRSGSFLPGDRALSRGLGFGRRVPLPAFIQERSGPPTFLGNPLCSCPALGPRWDPSAQSSLAFRVLPSAITTASAPTTSDLSGLYHTACSLAVYAS